MKLMSNNLEKLFWSIVKGDKKRLQRTTGNNLSKTPWFSEEAEIKSVFKKLCFELDIPCEVFFEAYIKLPGETLSV